MRAWTIKRYLDENGIYSLKNAHAAEPDPAASFLFGDLTGYCVHFAFSAVYLYRSLGIPARVGVGYSVPASNRAGGSSLLIQAIHGHAWPEVYFEDVGWVIIDPAPQQTLVDMTTDPQDNLQQLLGEMLRNDSSFEQFMNAQRESTFDPLASLRQIGRYLAIVAALIVMFGYLAKIQRRFAPHFGAGNTSITDRLQSDPRSARRRWSETRVRRIARRRLQPVARPTHQVSLSSQARIWLQHWVLRTLQRIFINLALRKAETRSLARSIGIHLNDRFVPSCKPTSPYGADCSAPCIL